MADGSSAVLATMPAVITAVRVVFGDMVEAGQVVVVLESMKLVALLTADTAGIAVDVACRLSETIAASKRLIVIEA